MAIKTASLETAKDVEYFLEQAIQMAEQEEKSLRNKSDELWQFNLDIRDNKAVKKYLSVSSEERIRTNSEIQYDLVNIMSVIQKLKTILFYETRKG